jgi:hypothetical protein
MAAVKWEANKDVSGIWSADYDKDTTGVVMLPENSKIYVAYVYDKSTDRARYIDLGTHTSKTGAFKYVNNWYEGQHNEAEQEEA